MSSGKRGLTAPRTRPGATRKAITSSNKHVAKNIDTTLFGDQQQVNMFTKMLQQGEAMQLRQSSMKQLSTKHARSKLMSKNMFSSGMAAKLTEQ